MAFGTEELRVLRRALALALHPAPASSDDVQDCLRLAESLDEAMREGARLRAFLVADLGRYRAALPGTAAGYLTLLGEALAAGHRPTPDDLAALRALRGNPAAAVLLRRCEALAEQEVRARLAGRAVPAGEAAALLPTVPASRARLTALPGGRSDGPPSQVPAGRAAAAGEPSRAPAENPGDPGGEPARKPASRPAPAAPRPAPAPAAPKPGRPIPTPGEVFPRRKPGQPSAAACRLAAG
ncbi:hypothetical protein ACIF8T_29760 [Streptomyces sp. NPDC085946]|uniref:hypothetical protein n=1 Tax=Streptomyces sp. NPDC085946 TaxID=3365744 RepID=UPI0037CF9080